MTGEPEALLALSHQTQSSLREQGDRGNGTELPQNARMAKAGGRDHRRRRLGRGHHRNCGFSHFCTGGLSLRRLSSASLISAALGPSTHTHSCGGLFRSLSPGPSIQGPLANGRLSQDQDLLRKVVPSAPELYCLLDSPWHLHASTIKHLLAPKFLIPSYFSSKTYSFPFHCLLSNTLTTSPWHMGY